MPRELYREGGYSNHNVTSRKFDIIYMIIGIAFSIPWVYIRFPEITNLWAYILATIFFAIWWPMLMLGEIVSFIINSPIANITIR